MESIRKEYTNRVEWQNENGEYHRLDGPAFEWFDGTKEWLVNGLRHREDGPAIEYKSGDKFWFLKGKQYSEKQYKEEIVKLKLTRIKDL